LVLNAIDLIPRGFALLVIQLPGSGARQPPLRAVHDRGHQRRLLYRIAAVVFVLFAAGHTLGFLGFKPPTAEALYVTAYLLFSAFLAWHLGYLAGSSPQAVAALGWIFSGVQTSG